MTREGASLETLELLGRLREEARSPEEKERLLEAMDALRFLSETGQTYDFEDYRQGLADNAPPLVIAAFTTREQAETWLQQHPRPPHHARVLIGGEYHLATYDRERERRYLPPTPILEFYLEELSREGLPPPVAAFKTREEAEAWLHSQAEPPRQVLILVAGERFLAAYHPRINLRALYLVPPREPSSAPGT